MVATTIMSSPVESTSLNSRPSNSRNASPSSPASTPNNSSVWSSGSTSVGGGVASGASNHRLRAATAASISHARIAPSSEIAFLISPRLGSTSPTSLRRSWIERARPALTRERATLRPHHSHRQELSIVAA